MLLGWKNQYCKNDYTTKCNLKTQCNPYEITNGIFHRTRTKKNPKQLIIHMNKMLENKITMKKVLALGKQLYGGKMHEK